MVRLLIAVLALFLMCFPASAVIRQLNSHPGADELAAQCSDAGGEFSWSEFGGGYSCFKANCDGKGGNCTVACTQAADCQGSTPSREVKLANLIGPNLFDSKLAPPQEFGLTHVSRGQVLGACRSVLGAVFGGNKSHYFCANPKCDPGIGPCYVECDLSKCIGAMAKKHGPTITLLGILQNGDRVSRIVTPPEKSSPNKESSSEEPPPPPPILIP